MREERGEEDYNSEANYWVTVGKYRFFLGPTKKLCKLLCESVYTLKFAILLTTRYGFNANNGSELLPSSTKKMQFSYFEKSNSFKFYQILYVK